MLPRRPPACFVCRVRATGTHAAEIVDNGVRAAGTHPTSSKHWPIARHFAAWYEEIVPARYPASGYLKTGLVIFR